MDKTNTTESSQNGQDKYMKIIEFRKWSIVLSLWKIVDQSKGLVIVPFFLSLGYGRMVDRLGKGCWFSLGSTFKPQKDYEKIPGINLRFFNKPLWTK